MGVYVVDQRTIGTCGTGGRKNLQNLNTGGHCLLELFGQQLMLVRVETDWYS